MDPIRVPNPATDPMCSGGSGCVGALLPPCPAGIIPAPKDDPDDEERICVGPYEYCLTGNTRYKADGQCECRQEKCPDGTLPSEEPCYRCNSSGYKKFSFCGVEAPIQPT